MATVKDLRQGSRFAYLDGDHLDPVPKTAWQTVTTLEIPKSCPGMMHVNEKCVHVAQKVLIA